jgi:hypothetical protein
MGWRLIRHVGDPHPWQDPNLGRAMAAGQLPVNIAERLAFFDKWQRQSILPGKSARILGPESGLSMTYQFGPEQYLVWMLDPDWEHLQSNRWERWQFIEVNPDWPPEAMSRPRMTKEQWMMLLDDFALLGPGRSASGRLSAAQLARDQQRREQVQQSDEKLAKFVDELEQSNSPRIHVVRR